MKFTIGGTVTVTLRGVSHIEVSFCPQPGAIPERFVVGSSTLISNEEVAQHASTVKQTLEFHGYKLEDTGRHEDTVGALVLVMTVTEAP